MRAVISFVGERGNRLRDCPAHKSFQEVRILWTIPREVLAGGFRNLVEPEGDSHFTRDILEERLHTQYPMTNLFGR